MVVDPHGWDRPTGSASAPRHLEAVQGAVIAGEQVHLGYTARDGQATSRLVHPLGLAAKGSVWYLVADTDAGLRTFRVDRVDSVHPTGDPVVRSEGFDLAGAWRLITEEVDQRRAPVRATALAEPDAVALCRWVFASRVRIGPPGPDGRVEVELRGQSTRSLAGEIAGFGAALEVQDPPEVRDHLARIGRELSAQY